MNICLFTKTTGAHGTGGVETHVEALCREVPRRGHRLTVLASKHPGGVDRENRHGAEVLYLNDTRPARYGRDFFRATLSAFRELNARNPFDVVWGEDFGAFGYAEVSNGAPRAPLLTIMQGSALPGYLRSEWNRLSTPAELLSFFTKFFPETLACYTLWYGRTVRGSDLVAAVSRETAEEYKRLHGLSDNRVTTVFNSVDTRFFRPDRGKGKAARAELGIKEGAFVVIMAAVAHKQKGMHIGMEVFGRLRDMDRGCRLLVAGDGPQLKDLKTMAARRGMGDSVLFLGNVARDRLAELHNASDLFLNPTLRLEGLPISTVEAMSSGLPVVLSAMGGTLSCAENGVSGYYAAPGDVDGFTDRAALILRNPGLREKIGAAARLRAERLFDEGIMIDRYLTLSEKIIRERGRTA